MTSRKALAATILALLLPLTAGCSAEGDSANPSKPATSSSSTAPHSNVPGGEEWTVAAPEIGSNATAKWGPQATQEGLDVALALLKHSYPEETVRTESKVDPEDLMTLTEYLTPQAANGWQRTVDAALRPTYTAQQLIEVWGLALVHVAFIGGGNARAELAKTGTVISNRRIHSVRVYPAGSGAHLRLWVEATTEADFAVTRGKQAGIKPLAKKIQLWLERQPDGGWLVDSWKFTLDPGKFTPTR